MRHGGGSAATKKRTCEVLVVADWEKYANDSWLFRLKRELVWPASGLDHSLSHLVVDPGLLLRRHRELAISSRLTSNERSKLIWGDCLQLLMSCDGRRHNGWTKHNRDSVESADRDGLGYR